MPSEQASKAKQAVQAKLLCGDPKQAMKASIVTFILILSEGISSKQAKQSLLFGLVGNVSVCQSVCVLSSKSLSVCVCFVCPSVTNVSVCNVYVCLFDCQEMYW